MFGPSKELIDKAISRRAFIQRMTAAGISLVGARAMAASLTGEDDATPAQSRVLENHTGGELMAEFLIDWNVPYVFGLAGSEEIGFLDALVDRTQLNYATCLHEHVAMAMADGYSRSTGDTSIVCLHSIAGAAYAFGQFVSTYRDRIPVVVTAGRQAVDYRGQDGCDVGGDHTRSAAACFSARRGATRRANICYIFQGLMGSAGRQSGDRAALAFTRCL